MRRVRDDAYRVHDALDAMRDAFHEAVPGVTTFALSLRAVRSSLSGSGGDLADLGRCLLRDVRRIARS